MRAQADAAQLDRIFFALADQNRRRMLELLGRGPASVSELATPLDMGLPSAVKHLAVLEQGGLVASQKAGRVRTYQLEAHAFEAMEAWVAKRKMHLGAQFDRLDALLKNRH